jgi:hypothetical protein
MIGRVKSNRLGCSQASRNNVFFVKKKAVADNAVV